MRCLNRALRRHAVSYRHGFLPLQGLEVPLLVLQSKVFLAVLLQDYTPFISKKRTFLRRVKAAIDKSLKGGMTRKRSDSPSPSSPPSGVNLSRSTTPDDLEHHPAGSKYSSSSFGRGGREAGATVHLEISHLFNKLPFPEPRRGISLRPREDADLPAV
jgi:hypothetical protein